MADSTTKGKDEDKTAITPKESIQAVTEASKDAEDGLKTLESEVAAQTPDGPAKDDGDETSAAPEEGASTDPSSATEAESAPTVEDDLTVEFEIHDSYIVLAHILSNPDGADYERGWLLFEEELGGPTNVQRLLDNHSIAVLGTNEANVAHSEYVIAAAAVQRAKERGN